MQMRCVPHLMIRSNGLARQSKDTYPKRPVLATSTKVLAARTFQVCAAQIYRKMQNDHKNISNYGCFPSRIYLMDICISVRSVLKVKKIVLTGLRVANNSRPAIRMPAFRQLKNKKRFNRAMQKLTYWTAVYT